MYGKVKAMHYMSDYDSKSIGDQSYVRFGFKGETQINDQLTGYGAGKLSFCRHKAERFVPKPALAFAGLEIKDIGSLTMDATSARCTMLEARRI